MTAEWRCRLFWGNPCTAPPGGQPRVILTALQERPHPIPTAIAALLGQSDYAPGTGWTIGWEPLEQRPVRRWSQEARARVRRGNLRRRLERKFPLFAEEFMAVELARRPKYFEGEYEQAQPQTAGDAP